MNIILLTIFQALADNVSFDEINYYLYGSEKVHRGFDGAVTEGAISHERREKAFT